MSCADLERVSDGSEPSDDEPFRCEALRARLPPESPPTLAGRDSKHVSHGWEGGQVW